MLAPALAAAVIVFLVLFNSPAGEIRDIDHIGSLALVNHPDDLKFKVKKDQNYYLDQKDHDIKVWTENGLVYLMVN